MLYNWGEVNLFTRPRRFGKSLNMSMLEKFFQPEGDKSIFDGLAISEEKPFWKPERAVFLTLETLWKKSYYFD